MCRAVSAYIASKLNNQEDIKAIAITAAGDALNILKESVNTTKS